MGPSTSQPNSPSTNHLATSDKESNSPALTSAATVSSNDSPSDCASLLSQSILRQYAKHISPIETQTETHQDHELIPQSENAISGDDDVKETTLTFRSGRVRAPAIELPPVPPPKGAGKQRTPSLPAGIPRQTILKAAMASKQLPFASPPTSSAPLGITGFPSIAVEQDKTAAQADLQIASPVNSSSLTARLANLQHSNLMSPQTASLLKSPCFFHQRFEGLVDIQKVLDETSEEDYSTSRLLQTATGVREISKQLQRRPLKRAVRTIMIVTRARDHSLVHMTRELAEWLMSTPRYGRDSGVIVYVDAKLRHSKRFDADGLVKSNPQFKSMLKYWTPDLCWTSPEKFDLVLTLGGDGTVLFTSWLFQRIVPPIFSFALGSLGFLTNFSFDHYKTHLDSIMGDKGMKVNLRMRFTCTVWRTDKSPNAEKGAMEEGEQFEVLNELVIDRGPSAYVSNLELYGDNELLTIVQADGCIFSTPTGSTAYSLSAGGSLIHPSIPAILLTPICPHSLSFRPMVLSDALSLRIAVPHKSRSSAYCSFDGKGRIELKQGDYVTLEASQYPFPTVMSGTNEWVESVQRALRWNVRGAEQKGWGDAGESADDADAQGAEEEWDIDIDVPSQTYNGTDSGIGQSEDGEIHSAGIGSQNDSTTGTASPMRRGLSLLTM